MQRLSRLTAPLLLAIVTPVWSAPAQPTTRAVAQASAPAPGADVLRPGDVVRLRIWREPDFSGDFSIDENGLVTLPRVGPWRVVDQPVERIKSQLVNAYKAYINQPSIEVIPLRRVQVTGAVRNPGLYTVDPTMTVADAVALAGGITRDGKRDRVLVVRGGVSMDARDLPQVAYGRSPLRSGDELYVPERSWLTRNPGVLVGAVSAVASVIWATRRR